MTTNFIKAAEGFDIYPAGSVATNYPWVKKNAAGGSITAAAGIFGGNALQFSGGTVASETYLEYMFPSTMQLQRNNTNAGGKGLFAVSGWINNITVTQNGDYPLIGIANTTDATFYNLLGVRSDATGKSLMFPSNFNNISSAPITFPVQSGPMWVNLRFAYSQGGVIFASYYINGYYKTTSVQLGWTVDSLPSPGSANKLKLQSGQNVTWQLDDLIVQNVSNADSNWVIAGTIPRVTDIPTLPVQQIYNSSVISNGSSVQWQSSSTAANYLAATNGTDHVIADSTLLAADLYKWSGTPATSIVGTVLRGSTTSSNVNAIQKVGSSLNDASVISVGNNRFIGITENDGTSAWTAASIAAAEFGMEEI